MVLPSPIDKLLTPRTTMNFRARQQNLRQQLEANRLDALLVSHLPNIRYLCGFTGSAGFLLLTGTRNIFFSDVRYDTQAREQVQGAKIVIPRKNVLTALGECMAAQNKRKPIILGIEATHMTVDEKKKLNGLLPSRVRLRSAPPLVERARMVKDAEEMDLIRSAVQLGAGLFGKALETIRPGAKESEVAAEMEYAARRAGAEEMSFPTIIASGVRSALPHGRASQQAIAPAGFVVCDFGVILDGYCSDQTRTVWVGDAVPAQARQAYDAVLEAQQAAIAVVRPGATVGEVDTAARKTLRKAGIAKYFTHSTGHGVGLEIHEPPRVAAGQTEVLKPGMVITIEPGVYFPGKWGIRIEDMVAVTGNGREILTPTGKGFIAV
ncbi:MAG TPA: Xaa-Pro peptidase family protein [Candidatus Binatia bacterium]|nr:Xaa-Pro peptidase family protein [Candidatus Binatia bacterium]